MIQEATYNETTRELTYSRTTPKKKAADLVMHSLCGMTYQLEDEDGMTERETDLVVAQMMKYKERIEEMLGFERGSWRIG